MIELYNIIISLNIIEKKNIINFINQIKISNYKFENNIFNPRINT